MPCLRTSYAVPISAAERAACGGQVLLLALTRYRPDVDELVPDLERPDRADRFEIPECLGQILLEFPELLGPAAAELVQVGHTQRVGRGVGGIEAVQP